MMLKLIVTINEARVSSESKLSKHSAITEYRVNSNGLETIG